MLAAESYKVVLAHQGLAAGVYVDVHPQLLALGDYRVDLVEAQVQLVAVLRRPAAGAVQVAGRGGVQQEGPGDIAAVFLPQLLLPGPAHQISVDDEVLKGGLEHVLVRLCKDAVHEPVQSAVRVLDDFPKCRPLDRETPVALGDEVVHPIH